MELYSVFDAFEAKGVVYETRSSVDIHRIAREVIQRFFLFFDRKGVIHEGSYLQAFRVVILFPISSKSILVGFVI